MDVNMEVGVRFLAVTMIALMAGFAAWAKEITPEFEWRRQAFFDCAEGQIQKLKQSRDSTESIVSAILTACEKERGDFIQIAVKLREFEIKRQMAPLERSEFSAAGEARMRELTNARLIEVRAN